MFKYTAKTHVALSVMKDGHSIHVSFQPVTGGGSVFSTNDPSLAKALEKHYKFGRLYKKVTQSPVTTVTAIARNEAANEVSAEQQESPIQEPTPAPKEKTMTFACYEDAKDYLVDTFGISRTKLRTQTAIQQAANAKGITLVIED